MPLVGMSSGMAGTNKEQPIGMRHNKMSSCKDGSAAERASRLTDTNTKERVAVWNAVAACVREQLLVQKGVWIPAFGSFNTVPKDIETEDRTVTLCWPVFHLARNLIAKHHLKPEKESLPAHGEVEPLKYSEVAAIAFVTWQRGKACVQTTVSLLSSCLQNGENATFVLKGIGVLFIDRLTFQMKFYYNFIEKLSGKKRFRKAVSKVSKFVPKALLSISRKSSRDLSGEVKPKKGEALPPLVQAKT
ncbi:hypothetical protein ASZ78_007665, partial [Callipepla squamata]